MEREDSSIRLSASDLMRFMSCPHASALDLERLHVRGLKPAEDRGRYADSVSLRYT